MESGTEEPNGALYFSYFSCFRLDLFDQSSRLHEIVPDQHEWHCISFLLHFLCIRNSAYRGELLIISKTGQKGAVCKTAPATKLETFKKRIKSKSNLITSHSRFRVPVLNLRLLKFEQKMGNAIPDLKG
jgi:hypothetical protein